MYTLRMEKLLDIGQQLIDARLERGWTQRELAARLDAHQQQIARWERERYGCVSLARLSRVAEVLGVAPWDHQQSQPLLAAETPAVYGTATAERVAPVSDLGEVVARIRRHADELHERFGVTRIDVFGSFARGEQRPDSDVDLIVEVENPTLETVFGVEDLIEELLGRKADIGTFAGLRPRVQPYVERERVNVWGT
ncbi:MAG: nucleotidyltransferase domain-containing protein [Coriobacteriia bacterium]